MRLLIAEDQTMLREAMRQLLLLEETVTTVFTAKNGREALRLLQTEAIDVAILDVEMPELSGLEVLEWVRAHLDIKVVIVTTFKRNGYFKRALASQVDAYVLKDRSIDELMSTLHTVLAGKKEYSPELMEGVTLHQNPLSEREQEVLALIAEGQSNQEIANQLFLSNGTIRNYTSSIFNKLGASNRIEAVRRAREKEWLD